jgi:hypothetical protein
MLEKAKSKAATPKKRGLRSPSDRVNAPEWYCHPAEMRRTEPHPYELMKMNQLTILGFTGTMGIVFLHANDGEWMIDTEKHWNTHIESSEGAVFEGGSVSPKEKAATILTKLHVFDDKRSAKSLTVGQSPIWQNWSPIENLGPSNLQGA